MPNVYFYWKTNTRVAQIADVMYRNRFDKIKRHLHFADNTKTPDHPPKDYKFSPLIDQCNKVANKIEPGESLSVDEQIMPYKGKNSGGLRQYNLQKPKKWGYNFFCFAASMDWCIIWSYIKESMKLLLFLITN